MQKEPSILHDVVKKVSKTPQDAAFAKETFEMQGIFVLFVQLIFARL